MNNYLGGIAIVMIIIIAWSSSNINKENALTVAAEIATQTHTPIPAIYTPTKMLIEERIVYSGTDGSGGQILIMDPDDGNVNQLTVEPGLVRRRPSISPNGDKIIFTSGQWGDMNLYLMNPDGSDLTNLTELKGDENEPKWSPDG